MFTLDCLYCFCLFSIYYPVSYLLSPQTKLISDQFKKRIALRQLSRVAWSGLAEAGG